VTAPTIAAAGTTIPASTICAMTAAVTVPAEAPIPGAPSELSEFYCERKPQNDAEDDRNLERSDEIDMHRAII
jgi:hypothetical protein